MTIRKGEEWGHRTAVPESFAIAEDDFDLAGHDTDIPVAVRRGDLHHALGKPHLPRRGSECTIVPIDALLCRIRLRGGETLERLASSGVTIGSWWSGEFVAITNSGFIQGMNIAPRSHPNDGEADALVLAAEMSRRQRLLARRRARTGTHVPHPHVSLRRVTRYDRARQHRRERLSVDGRAVSEWEHVEVAVIADHWSVMV